MGAHPQTVEASLRFDDRVQAALFNRQRLVKTYPASAITRPFRFNAYYAEWQYPYSFCLKLHRHGQSPLNET